MTCVSWFDAVEYCEWLSAQWGFACDCLPRPNGNSPRAAGSKARSIRGATRLPERAMRTAGAGCDGPEPVATSAPNGYGLFDMCENVHEWCSDWYDPRYYAVSPAENPRGPRAGTRQASRGGAWRHHIKIARCAARSSIPPEFRYADYGFRVAADGDRDAAT